MRLLSTKQGIATATGAVLQAAFKGHYVEQLSQGWETLKENGKVAEDQFTCETITEMADFLDSMKVADQTRFDVAQNFFNQCCRNDRTENERHLIRQLLILIRELSSEEIRILRAAYELNKETANAQEKPTGFDEWSLVVAKKLGHNLRHLVARYDEHMISLSLLGYRTLSDKSGLSYIGNYRLTDLGLRFCSILEEEPN